MSASGDSKSWVDNLTIIFKTKSYHIAKLAKIVKSSGCGLNFLLFTIDIIIFLEFWRKELIFPTDHYLFTHEPHRSPVTRDTHNTHSLNVNHVLGEKSLTDLQSCAAECGKCEKWCSHGP